MAARVKVIDLAKELGVTSKDLIVALEAMGQKAMRAMSPLQTATANELRVKLGRGRDLPEEGKPKRAPKAKPASGEAKEHAAPKKKAAGSATAAKGTRKKGVTIQAQPPAAPPPRPRGPSGGSRRFPARRRRSRRRRPSRGPGCRLPQPDPRRRHGASRRPRPHGPQLRP